MSSEDQQILERIGLLAGQINRHKNGQVFVDQPQYQAARNNSYHGYNHLPSTAWHTSRGGYSSRGSGRGGRVAKVHRNRTLVLNGNSSVSHTPESKLNEENSKLNAAAPSTNSAWVSKTDHSLQIINSAIYEKDSEKRAKTQQEILQHKLRLKDEREKSRVARHIQRSVPYNPYAPAASTVSQVHEIQLQGIAFRVIKGGSKLVKNPGDPHPPSATPKSAVIGGVRFFRSKNGNMYRSGVIKAHQRNAGFQKIQEPCKTFTTTGSCLKGPRCRYIHDPSKVAVCKDFLAKGSCPSGDACDLSHELSLERVPACLHFAKGNCTNPNCRYAHVRTSPSAPVCRAFGIYGYCEKGAMCIERHVSECPDFSNAGKCSTKGCKLLHRSKASVMRTNTNNNDRNEDEMSDVSSDEEEEIGEDDVDSDDLEEFLGDEDGNVDSDIPMQQDYVQLL